MHSLITFLASLLAYGITLAGLRIYSDLLISRSVEKRLRYHKRQRIREHRSTGVKIDPMHVVRYQEGPCHNVATRRYLQKTPSSALTRCTMMVARKAEHNWTHSTHIHN